MACRATLIFALVACLFLSALAQSEIASVDLAGENPILFSIVRSGLFNVSTDQQDNFGSELGAPNGSESILSASNGFAVSNDVEPPLALHDPKSPEAVPLGATPSSTPILGVQMETDPSLQTAEDDSSWVESSHWDEVLNFKDGARLVPGSSSIQIRGTISPGKYYWCMLTQSTAPIAIVPVLPSDQSSDPTLYECKVPHMKSYAAGGKAQLSMIGSSDGNLDALKDIKGPEVAPEFVLAGMWLSTQGPRVVSPRVSTIRITGVFDPSSEYSCQFISGDTGVRFASKFEAPERDGTSVACLFRESPELASQLHLGEGATLELHEMPKEGNGATIQLPSPAIGAMSFELKSTFGGMSIVNGSRFVLGYDYNERWDFMLFGAFEPTKYYSCQMNALPPVQFSTRSWWMQPVHDGSAIMCRFNDTLHPVSGGPVIPVGSNVSLSVLESPSRYSIGGFGISAVPRTSDGPLLLFLDTEWNSIQPPFGSVISLAPAETLLVRGVFALYQYLKIDLKSGDHSVFSTEWDTMNSTGLGVFKLETVKDFVLGDTLTFSIAESFLPPLDAEREQLSFVAKPWTYTLGATWWDATMIAGEILPGNFSLSVFGKFYHSRQYYCMFVDRNLDNVPLSSHRAFPVAFDATGDGSEITCHVPPVLQYNCNHVHVLKVMEHTKETNGQRYVIGLPPNATEYTLPAYMGQVESSTGHLLIPGVTNITVTGSLRVGKSYHLHVVVEHTGEDIASQVVLASGLIIPSNPMEHVIASFDVPKLSQDYGPGKHMEVYVTERTADGQDVRVLHLPNAGLFELAGSWSSATPVSGGVLSGVERKITVHGYFAAQRHYSCVLEGEGIVLQSPFVRPVAAQNVAESPKVVECEMPASTQYPAGTSVRLFLLEASDEKGTDFVHITSSELPHFFTLDSYWTAASTPSHSSYSPGIDSPIVVHGSFLANANYTCELKPKSLTTRSILSQPLPASEDLRTIQCVFDSHSSGVAESGNLELVVLQSLGSDIVPQRIYSNTSVTLSFLASWGDTIPESGSAIRPLYPTNISISGNFVPNLFYYITLRDANTQSVLARTQLEPATSSSQLLVTVPAVKDYIAGSKVVLAVHECVDAEGHEDKTLPSGHIVFYTLQDQWIKMQASGDGQHLAPGIDTITVTGYFVPGTSYALELSIAGQNSLVSRSIIASEVAPTSPGLSTLSFLIPALDGYVSGDEAHAAVVVADDLGGTIATVPSDSTFSFKLRAYWSTADPAAGSFLHPLQDMQITVTGSLEADLFYQVALVADSPNAAQPSVDFVVSSFAQPSSNTTLVASLPAVADYTPGSSLRLVVRESEHASGENAMEISSPASAVSYTLGSQLVSVQASGDGQHLYPGIDTVTVHGYFVPGTKFAIRVTPHTPEGQPPLKPVLSDPIEAPEYPAQGSKAVALIFPIPLVEGFTAGDTATITIVAISSDGSTVELPSASGDANTPPFAFTVNAFWTSTVPAPGSALRPLQPMTITVQGSLLSDLYYQVALIVVSNSSQRVVLSTSAFTKPQSAQSVEVTLPAVEHYSAGQQVRVLVRQSERSDGAKPEVISGPKHVTTFTLGAEWLSVTASSDGVHLYPNIDTVTVHGYFIPSAKYAIQYSSGQLVSSVSDAVEAMPSEDQHTVKLTFVLPSMEGYLAGDVATVTVLSLLPDGSSQPVLSTSEFNFTLNAYWSATQPPLGSTVRPLQPMQLSVKGSLLPDLWYQVSLVVGEGDSRSIVSQSQWIQPQSAEVLEVQLPALESYDAGTAARVLVHQSDTSDGARPELISGPKPERPFVLGAEWLSAAGSGDGMHLAPIQDTISVTGYLIPGHQYVLRVLAAHQVEASEPVSASPSAQGLSTIAFPIPLVRGYEGGDEASVAVVSMPDGALVFTNASFSFRLQGHWSTAQPLLASSILGLRPTHVTLAGSFDRDLFYQLLFKDASSGNVIAQSDIVHTDSHLSVNMTVGPIAVADYRAGAKVLLSLRSSTDVTGTTDIEEVVHLSAGGLEASHGPIAPYYVLSAAVVSMHGPSGATHVAPGVDSIDAQGYFIAGAKYALQVTIPSRHSPPFASVAVTAKDVSAHQFASSTLTFKLPAIAEYTTGDVAKLTVVELQADATADHATPLATLSEEPFTLKDDAPPVPPPSCFNSVRINELNSQLSVYWNAFEDSHSVSIAYRCSAYFGFDATNPIGTEEVGNKTQVSFRLAVNQAELIGQAITIAIHAKNGDGLASTCAGHYLTDRTTVALSHSNTTQVTVTDLPIHSASLAITFPPISKDTEIAAFAFRVLTKHDISSGVLAAVDPAATAPSQVNSSSSSAHPMLESVFLGQNSTKNNNAEANITSLTFSGISFVVDGVTSNGSVVHTQTPPIKISIALPLVKFSKAQLKSALLFLYDTDTSQWVLANTTCKEDTPQVPTADGTHLEAYTCRAAQHAIFYNPNAVDNDSNDQNGQNGGNNDNNNNQGGDDGNGNGGDADGGDNDNSGNRNGGGGDGDNGDDNGGDTPVGPPSPNRHSLWILLGVLIPLAVGGTLAYLRMSDLKAGAPVEGQLGANLIPKTKVLLDSPPAPAQESNQPIEV